MIIWDFTIRRHLSKESDFEITHVFAKFFSGLVYFIANKTNNISCFVFIVTLCKIITCLYVLQKKIIYQ